MDIGPNEVFYGGGAAILTYTFNPLAAIVVGAATALMADELVSGTALDFEVK